MPRKKPEPEDKPPMSRKWWEHGLLSIVGAAAVALAGLVGAGLMDFWRSVTRPPDFPPHAIVFTTASECGKGWDKITGNDIRFIVMAGGGQRPGEPAPGRTKVKLEPDNLPPIAVRLSHRSAKAALEEGKVPVVMELSVSGGEGLKQETLTTGSRNNKEIDITPPGFALIACKRRD
jgi:hypothetical protein